MIGTLTALALVVAAYIFGLAYFQSRKYDFYDFEDLIEPRVIGRRDRVLADLLLQLDRKFPQRGGLANAAWRWNRRAIALSALCQYFEDT